MAQNGSLAVVYHYAIKKADRQHFAARTPTEHYNQLSSVHNSIVSLHLNPYEDGEDHIHLVVYLRYKNKKKEIFKNILEPLLARPTFEDLDHKIETLHNPSDIKRIMNHMLKCSDFFCHASAFMLFENPRNNQDCDVLDSLCRCCNMAAHPQATPCFPVLLV